MDDGCWSCKRCDHLTSVTVGTVFNRNRTALKDLFTAAWYMTEQKDGISANDLQQKLRLNTYHTAWSILHKLRAAMGSYLEPLVGHVEFDIARVGRNQIAIAVQIVRSGGQPQIRLHRVCDHSPYALLQLVGKIVLPRHAAVQTDKIDAHSLIAAGYRVCVAQAHESSPHGSLKAADVVGQLNTWLSCTYRGAGRITAKHLDSYLDEFCFLFNFRGSAWPGHLFHILLKAALDASPTRCRPSRAKIDMNK